MILLNKPDFLSATRLVDLFDKQWIVLVTTRTPSSQFQGEGLEWFDLPTGNENGKRIKYSSIIPVLISKVRRLRSVRA